MPVQVLDELGTCLIARHISLGSCYFITCLKRVNLQFCVKNRLIMPLKHFFSKKILRYWLQLGHQMMTGLQSLRIWYIPNILDQKFLISNIICFKHEILMQTDLIFTLKSKSETDHFQLREHTIAKLSNKYFNFIMGISIWHLSIISFLVWQYKNHPTNALDVH